MTQYDPSVIYTFADRLYRSAQQTIAIFAVIGALIGIVAGGTVGGIIGAVIGAVIVGFLGYLIGNQRAFQLKLQAQLALCQVKIEENTRKP